MKKFTIFLQTVIILFCLLVNIAIPKFSSKSLWLGIEKYHEIFSNQPLVYYYSSISNFTIEIVGTLLKEKLPPLSSKDNKASGKQNKNDANTSSDYSIVSAKEDVSPTKYKLNFFSDRFEE